MTQLKWSRQVATDQSADRSAHSKELTLPLDQTFLQFVALHNDSHVAYGSQEYREQNGSLKIPFEQGVVLLNVGSKRAVLVEPWDIHQLSMQRNCKCVLQL